MVEGNNREMKSGEGGRSRAGMKAQERVESSLLDLMSYLRLVRDWFESRKGSKSFGGGKDKFREKSEFCLPRTFGEASLYLSQKIEMYRKRDSDESEN